MQKQPPQGGQPATGDAVDIDPIIARTREGIPPQLQAIYDKAVLSGMRIMFDKNSFQMTMEELQQPGPLAERISNGVIKLVYMLWQQSRQTLPPQIIVPVTLTMALKAFAFTQMIQDPEATKEAMGEACASAVQGVMDRFGATEDKLPALVNRQNGGSKNQDAPSGAPQQQGGMLAAALGGV